MVGLQIDSKISDFIRDSIQKIIKIIRSVSVSEEIYICIRIQKILTDMDTVWLLPIRNRPLSYYPSISDII
jgi:ethanolamine utilization cobalamin adenosyltransferase